MLNNIHIADKVIIHYKRQLITVYYFLRQLLAFYDVISWLKAERINPIPANVNKPETTLLIQRLAF